MIDMKYIDADKLKTGITKERKNIEGMFVEGDNTFWDGQDDAYCYTLALIDSLQQEQKDVDLEKFTEKMDAWKARYNYPDNIIVKGAMAFTARMFYMYPNIAREWYDSLPKVTMD